MPYDTSPSCGLVPGAGKGGPGWYLVARNNAVEAGPFMSPVRAMEAVAWMHQHGMGVNPAPWMPQWAPQGLTVGIRVSPRRSGPGPGSLLPSSLYGPPQAPEDTMAATNTQTQFDPEDLDHIGTTVTRPDRGMVHIGARAETALSFGSPDDARRLAVALATLATDMEAMGRVQRERALDAVGRIP